MTIGDQAPTRGEKLSAVVALAVILGCVGVLFSSCGGDDLIVPGNIVIPTDVVDPTETPDPDLA